MPFCFVLEENFMKKQYKTPLFEVLELVADESLCVVGESNQGENELNPDDLFPAN